MVTRSAATAKVLGRVIASGVVPRELSASHLQVAVFYFQRAVVAVDADVLRNGDVGIWVRFLVHAPLGTLQVCT